LNNSKTDFYIYHRNNKILSCCFGAPPVSLSTRTWLSPQQTTTEFTQQTRSNPDWLLSVPYSTRSRVLPTHAREFDFAIINTQQMSKDRERELLT